jgi:hypothetical protein
MFLPAIPVFDAKNFSSDLQLAKAAMSPVEYSWKHRQRGPRKKGAGMFLPVHVVPLRTIAVTAGVFSNTLMSPVEHAKQKSAKPSVRKTHWRHHT